MNNNKKKKHFTIYNDFKKNTQKKTTLPIALKIINICDVYKVDLYTIDVYLK